MQVQDEEPDIWRWQRLLINTVFDSVMWILGRGFVCLCLRGIRVSTHVFPALSLYCCGKGVADRCPFFLDMQFITPLLVETFSVVQMSIKKFPRRSVSLPERPTGSKPISPNKVLKVNNCSLLLLCCILTLWFLFSCSLAYYLHTQNSSKYTLTKHKKSQCAE